MIIVNLKGGIGNQMFQYAMGKKLAIKNSDVLKLETAGLARANDVGDIYRPFSLDAFNIDNKVATEKEVQSIKYPYGIISKGIRWANVRIFKKTNTVFNPKALEQTGDIFLDGYWQSPLFFDDIRDMLLTEYTLRTPLSPAVKEYQSSIHAENSVSIHIRRGDYATNPRVIQEFGICQASYYQAAIAHMHEHVENPVFFVFSDDIAWVKEHLELPASVIFIQNHDLKDVEELALMTMCAHSIIANSTFSWWGAWLNQNPDKIVIAPTPWFEKTTYDEHLIPTTWIQLPKS